MAGPGDALQPQRPAERWLRPQASATASQRAISLASILIPARALPSTGKQMSNQNGFPKVLYDLRLMFSRSICARHLNPSRAPLIGSGRFCASDYNGPASVV